MNTKQPVYTVPVPSTNFTREAYLDCSGITPELRYGYESETAEYCARIRFEKVAALRTRSERFCSAWHIEGAYDTLVEVTESSWIAEILGDVPAQYRAEWMPRHFMIYLDSVGCFEFLAQSWEALQDHKAQ